MKPVVIANPWAHLRRHTPARIALGRSGISLPTAPQLAFQLAHAQARDAVHRAFDVAATAAAIEALGLPTVTVHSAAADRPIYLQRPDLGRRLDAASAAALQARREAPDGSAQRCDLGLVVADGLSALAVERHAAPFIAALLAELHNDAPAWRVWLLVASKHVGGYRGIMFDYNDAHQRQGSAVFYPSYLGHTMSEVTRGKRRALLAWASGPSFK